MDYTKLTLGKLLGSEDTTIKRNAMSILKTCQACDHRMESGACVYCFKRSKECPHDFDAYGKCCLCGKWRHQVPEEE